ncbi:MAG: hypothetical protein FIB02_10075 [Desulfuromonas sp.]|nr:hypothetical protein [Desulfuromonas sp.]
MKRITMLAALMLTVTLAAGCAPTKVKDAWKKPGFTGKVHKVYLIGVTRNDKFRKIFENEMARLLKAQGVTGIPSYPDLVISGDVDRETLRARLRAQGTDAVLVARIAGEEQRTAAYSARESGYGIGTGPINVYYEEYYNGSVAVVASGPAVESSFQVISIRSNLFETESAQVVWSALTETTATDDNRVQRLKEFVEILALKLKEDGLL